MAHIQGPAGLLVIMALAWALSEKRRRFPFKIAILGIGSQIAIAVILLKVPIFQRLFIALNSLVMALEAATTAGTTMVFGFLGGGPPPFEVDSPGHLYILAFRALPLILVISALSALLFYWRILPWVVRGFAWCLTRSLGIGGAEGLGVAANVFVGMVEAPLFIRPYLLQMTRSELFSLMVAGMATIAGTVMVLYASLLGGLIPGVMGHILVASIISVPAAVVIAKIMIPENSVPTAGRHSVPSEAHNSMDAVTRGTMQGVQLLINIVAMLVVLVALVHLINLVLGLLPNWGGTKITLQTLLGLITAPLVWLIGIPWSEAPTAGALLATKTVLNEFIAYLDLSRLPPGALSERSLIIMIYAMCGFANPGSLGIMIGGLSTMAPERRAEIVSLGIRSILAGTLATCMTGAVVGLIR
ncbi:MAG: nucleoside:proton symporter [Desulfobacteraceae bacterium]|nr:MAG: nucleoside:proton symporter [Desulfobacteraceae bacterium]